MLEKVSKQKFRNFELAEILNYKKSAYINPTQSLLTSGYQRGLVQKFWNITQITKFDMGLLEKKQNEKSI
jgi:hypothetical protein